MEFSFYANGNDPVPDAWLPEPETSHPQVPQDYQALIIRSQSTGGLKTGAELRHDFLPQTELPSELQEVNGPKSSHGAGVNITYTKKLRKKFGWACAHRLGLPGGNHTTWLYR